MVKMAIKYDKENKLWTNFERIPLNQLETSLGQWIWDSLLLHGPKIAQVIKQSTEKNKFNDFY